MFLSIPVLVVLAIVIYVLGRTVAREDTNMNDADESWFPSDKD